MSKERASFYEKAIEWSKNIDIATIAAGLAVMALGQAAANPTIYIAGINLVVFSGLTLAAASALEKKK